MLRGALFYNLYFYWQPAHSYTTWKMGFFPHWDIGGVFLIDLFSLIAGLVIMFAFAAVRPAFFKGETLNRDTPTMVPEDLGTPVGLFGIDTSDR